MNEIEVTSNITITIKGQTFVLSRQEAVELFDKLERAGAGERVAKLPISPFQPTYVPTVPTVPSWPSWPNETWPSTTPASPPPYPIWY